MPGRRRNVQPTDRIEAVTLHNTQDAVGRYIPMQFSINSWVTLEPDLESEWGRDSAHYPVTSPHYYWKAMIVGFQHGGEGNLINKVRVRHAYEVRQLEIDPALPQPRLPCNYLFPSFFDDLVDPASITGLIVGMHADLGEVIHHDRTHRELRDASVFFYKWVYAPPAGERIYGQLEEIALPTLGSSCWPLPDMCTSEAFRAKLRMDFHASLKPNTGSRRSHLQWFVPFTVFVDLFASSNTRVRTPSLFTFRNLDDAVFSDLMDEGWSTKTTDAGDVIRCSVSLPSVVFRYHIARQTLYVNFFFTRERQVDRRWVAMEQQSVVQLVVLDCEVIDSVPPLSLTFNVGLDWPIGHLRGEVQIAMGKNAPTDFYFMISERGQPDGKVNRRREIFLTVADILAPRRLKMKIIEL